MGTSRITTHVLDITCGRPAVGVSARLYFQQAEGWQEIGSNATNDDGRIANLGPAELPAGNYRLELDTGAYFERLEKKSFFTSVCMCLTLDDPTQHYHVPLLISPFAMSTYKGS